MKLRIQGNSIRLRLKRSEVDRFAQHGVIEDSIRFGSGENTVLSFELKASQTAEKIHASFHSNRIVIDVPHALAGNWFDTDQIGFEGSVPVGDGEILEVVIEKDFACLKPRAGDDDQDTFQNPNIEMKC